MSNFNDLPETGCDTPSDFPCLQKLDSPTESHPKQTLSEVMEVENCLTNLSLAHEIVINGDFRFKQNTPPKDSLEGRVTEIVHLAFWDNLRAQLSLSPPEYTHAVILLSELKTTLLSLLLPAHVRLRAQLEEALDLELIWQQADHGVLDLRRLGGYVVDTMAALCAPVRDPEIGRLRGLSDTVELLREVFRVLGLMKTDMVNFTVQSLRPHLLQQAVQYERAKFQEILEKQPASLDNTATWLQGAVRETASSSVPAQCDSLPSGEPEESFNRGAASLSPVDALNRAYVRLLNWDSDKTNLYPETVRMDRARLDMLGEKLKHLVLEASVLLVTSTQSGGAVFSLPGFVGKLKQTINALLEGSHSRAFNLREALLGLSEQVLLQVDEALITQGGAPMSLEAGGLLKGQISDLATVKNPICGLLEARAHDYLLAVLAEGTGKRAPSMPPALRLVSAELLKLGADLGRIVHFNRSVFGPFYSPILRKLLLSTGETETEDDSR